VTGRWWLGGARCKGGLREKAWEKNPAKPNGPQLPAAQKGALVSLFTDQRT
jgi:hypothetical protein